MPDSAPPSPPGEDLDALIARVDPDRWLSSRFIADEQARADVIALYAFDYELARIPGAVTQPMLGEIRLAWWREGLDEVFEGRSVRGHPTLQALAMVIARRALARAPFDAMIDARMRELDPEPFADEAELHGWLDHAVGAVTTTAVRVLAPGADGHLAEAAARAWGLAMLIPGGKRLPAAWSQSEGRARLRTMLSQARREAARLPAEAFPAVAHATLARTAGRGRLLTRLRLLAAVATGRV